MDDVYEKLNSEVEKVYRNGGHLDEKEDPEPATAGGSLTGQLEDQWDNALKGTVRGFDGVNVALSLVVAPLKKRAPESSFNELFAEIPEDMFLDDDNDTFYRGGWQRD